MALKLLSLMLLAIVAIMVGNYASDILLKDRVNSTDTALNVVLEDPDVRQAISDNGDNYTARILRMDARSTKGFINYSGNLVGVYVQSAKPSAPYQPIHYYFIVDTDRRRIVDESSWREQTPGDNVTIPPGSAWYHLVISSTTSVKGAYANVVTFMQSGYTPADANVSQILVSADHLSKLMRRSRSIPLQDIDVSSYGTFYNQTKTFGANWRASIAWPSVEACDATGIDGSGEPVYRTDNNYYVVVINREQDRDVRLSQTASTGSAW